MCLSFPWLICKVVVSNLPGVSHFYSKGVTLKQVFCLMMIQKHCVKHLVAAYIEHVRAGCLILS